MNIATLTDFTPQQIDIVLDAIQEGIDTNEMTQVRAELWDESEVRTKILDGCEIIKDTLNLFRAQLLNAKAVVSKQEEIISN
jgi:hypothetical protein